MKSISYYISYIRTIIKIIFFILIAILVGFLLFLILIISISRGGSTTATIYDSDTCLPILSLEYSNKYWITSSGIHKCNHENAKNELAVEINNDSRLTFNKNNVSGRLYENNGILSMHFNKTGTRPYSYYGMSTDPTLIYSIYSAQDMVNTGSPVYASYTTKKLGRTSFTYFFNDILKESSGPYIFTPKYIISINYDDTYYFRPKDKQRAEDMKDVANSILSTIKLYPQNYNK